MPKHWRLHPSHFCAMMAVLLAPAMAWSDEGLNTRDLRAKLRVIEARAPEDALGAQDVPALLAELGLKENLQPIAKTAIGFGGAGGLFSLQSAKPAAAQPGITAQTGPVDVSTTNFRLMLATLAQSYTGVNNLSVITAQGARGPIALSVTSGTVTLADLQSFSHANGFAPRADGTLTAPVVLWPDATLRLGTGERLGMARDSGAFLMSMGRIEADGALIESVGPENAYEPGFMPFITVLAGGSISLKNATLRGLGFGRTIKFAGLTVAGNPMMPTKQEVVIQGTLFDQIKTVTIAGAPDAEISGNTFQNARNVALNVMGSPRTKVQENLFRGGAPTNAIRIDLGSDRVEISDNLFMAGSRVAVLINGGSNHVLVRDNLIWRRDGAGIKFFGALCGRAEGNILIDNAQKGIEVRKSDGTVVLDNVFAGNRSAGVWVSAQADGARTAVRDNTFEGNGSGLAAATGAEIWISGNNFKRQLPKLLDGDIASLTTSVVRDLSGSGPLRLVRGASETHPADAPLCGGDA
ncbi:MAG: right-handed parallel beta-helix repeat-containing protein [Sulfitobacter sp.]